MFLPSIRAITICSLTKLCHGDLHLWNTAECVCLVRAIVICSHGSLEYCRMCLPSAGQQNVMENGVTGILQNMFTFCRATERHGERRHWNTAEYVYFLQGNRTSWRTASLKYCRICLLSAGQQNVMENGVTGILQNMFTFCRATECHGERRHWNTAEYVYFLQGNRTSWRTASLKYCECVYFLQGNRTSWRTASLKYCECVYFLQGNRTSWRTASLEYCRICLLSAGQQNVMENGVTEILRMCLLSARAIICCWE